MEKLKAKGMKALKVLHLLCAVLWAGAQSE